MRKLILSFLSLIAFSAKADITNSYIHCLNGDDRGPWTAPVVSTVVISPEVDGKRYFVSWVGGDEEQGFSGIGPRELVDFAVSESAVKFTFPRIEGVKVHQYLSFVAKRTDETFYVLRSLSGRDVHISYLVKNIFGRMVTRTTGVTANVQCYTKSVADMMVYIDPNIYDVKLDAQGIQSYHFSDMRYVSQWSRNLQESLLVDFINNL